MMIVTALRLLKIQFFLIIATFFVAFFFQICIMPCYSLAYGAILVLLNTLLALIAAKFGEILAHRSVPYALVLMFFSAGVRFVLLGIFFAFGLMILNLSPVPMVVTFISVLLISQIINLVIIRH